MNTGASYNQAMYDLQALTTAPASAVAGLVQDLRAHVENGFLPPDNTDVAGTADYHTLISSSDLSAIHSAAATVLAQVQGITGTTPTPTPAPVQSLPPSNSGGFSPGGGSSSGSTAAAGGGGSVTPQKIVTPAAAAAGVTQTAPPNPGAIVNVTTAPITCPPGSTQLTDGSCSDATQPGLAPTRGVSIPAALFIGLGALLLGGVLVYMFQPELLGMKKNPLPKKRRRKKRKS